MVLYSGPAVPHHTPHSHGRPPSSPPINPRRLLFLAVLINPLALFVAIEFTAPFQTLSTCRIPLACSLLRYTQRASAGSAPARHKEVAIPGWLGYGGEEDRAEAGPPRPQGQAEGTQSSLHSPRHRLALRGHEGRQDDGDRPGRPRRRGDQAAQGRLAFRPDRLHQRLAGEEGRKEG